MSRYSAKGNLEHHRFNKERYYDAHIQALVAGELGKVLTLQADKPAKSV